MSWQTFLVGLWCCLPILGICEERTIVVIRHVDRENGNDDSGISGDGRKRAAGIAEKLQAFKITRVFHTHLPRSVETVDALIASNAFTGTLDSSCALDEQKEMNTRTDSSGARETVCRHEIVKSNSTNALLGLVTARRCDTAMLIVDHSERIDEIMKNLGWREKRPQLSEYGQIFVLTFNDTNSSGGMSTCYALRPEYFQRGDELRRVEVLN